MGGALNGIYETRDKAETFRTVYQDGGIRERVCTKW